MLTSDLSYHQESGFIISFRRYFYSFWIFPKDLGIQEADAVFLFVPMAFLIVKLEIHNGIIIIPFSLVVNPLQIYLPVDACVSGTPSGAVRAPHGA